MSCSLLICHMQIFKSIDFRTMGLWIWITFILIRTVYYPFILGIAMKWKLQTTMWIGWVESTFTNPTVKVWADLDNPFKEKGLCKIVYVALSGWNSSRICDITRGQLSIDFVHRFSQLIFLGYQYSFWSSSFITACTFISALTYLSIKEEGRYIFMKSKFKKKFVYSSIRQLYCCDITDIKRVPPETATYTKLMKPLKNHISWLDYPNLTKPLLLGF